MAWVEELAVGMEVEFGLEKAVVFVWFAVMLVQENVPLIQHPNN
jgi:hypothetical protein